MSVGHAGRSGTSLDLALESLVARGTISAEQREAILAEVAGAPELAGAAPPARRSLTDALVEVGLYVGSALVLAAAFALVAQSWEDLARAAQIAILAVVAVLTGSLGWALSRGAAAGSPRRRLAGVVLTGTAASAAGTVALLMGEGEMTGVVALSVALAVMVAAQVLATSAVTEIGMFVAAFALLNVTGEVLRPEPGELGYGYEESRYDQLMPLGSVAFGILWAGVASRRLMHKELAVALGFLVALGAAMPLAGMDETRVVGLVSLAALAALGFWRFLAEGRWPWIAGAIGSVTAFVFFAVGDRGSPALAFLVAGLVLLGSSALGWRVARRRRDRETGRSAGSPGPGSGPEQGSAPPPVH